MTLCGKHHLKAAILALRDHTPEPTDLQREMLPARDRRDRRVLGACIGGRCTSPASLIQRLREKHPDSAIARLRWRS